MQTPAFKLNFTTTSRKFMGFEKFLRTVLVLSAGVLTLTGCASKAALDRSQLNHAALDFGANRTPTLAYPLSKLNGIQDAAQSGGCSVCAH